MRISLRRSFIVALAVAVSVGAAGDVLAATAQEKCSAGLQKAAGKYVKGRAKVLTKCNDSLLKAKAGFNGQQGAGCRSLDGKTQDALDKIAGKLEAGVDKACGGSSKTCQDGDALDLDDPAIGWGPSGGFAGTCPGFEDELSCQFIIDDCGGAASSGNGVSDCLLCINDEAVDQALDVLYGDLDPTNFGAGAEPEKTRNKCQQALVKSSAKYLLAKSKIRAKCWAALDKGKAGFSSTDALGCIDGSGKTDDKIAKAESKKIAGICKKCGGPGKECEVAIGPVGGDGLTDDLDPQTEIGFGTDCPDLVLPYPPNTDCGTLDDLPSGTMSDLIDSSEELVRCIDCVLDYKVDCMDRAVVPHREALPLACAVTPTPAPTPTLTPTATGTLTPTPTVTATSTPLPSCGDNVLDAGEECDLAQGPCAGSCAPLSLGADACSCPVGTFDVSARAGADLDTGWTGIGHDQPALEGFLFPADAYGCSSGGPDTNCSFVARYQTPFFGPPLPLSTGGVPVCVVNEVFGEATGALDLATGAFNYDYDLTSKAHTGLFLEQPCPLCEGDIAIDDDVKDGTCTGGPSDGASCDADASSSLFGETSFDCFPDPASNIGNLPIVFRNATTGTLIETLVAGSPSCSGFGFTNAQCFCDTCDNLAATPCRTHADCTAVGATTCGGLRCLDPPFAGDPCTSSLDCGGGTCGLRGEPTKSNACLSTVCSPIADNEGECTTGPFTSTCGPTETFRQCTSSGDCPVLGDTCVPARRLCFPDPSVVRTGTASFPDGIYAGTFCIPPTSSGAVNVTAGFPGLGTLLLPYSIGNVTVP